MQREAAIGPRVAQFLGQILRCCRGRCCVFVPAARPAAAAARGEPRPAPPPAPTWAVAEAAASPLAPGQRCSRRDRTRAAATTARSASRGCRPPPRSAPPAAVHRVYVGVCGAAGAEGGQGCGSRWAGGGRRNGRANGKERAKGAWCSFALSSMRACPSVGSSSFTHSRRRMSETVFLRPFSILCGQTSWSECEERARE